MRCTRLQERGTFLWGQALISSADEVYPPLQADTIYLNTNDITITYFAKGSAHQGLWSDMTNACSCRDAREARIGDQGDAFPELQVFQRRRELIRLFHTCS